MMLRFAWRTAHRSQRQLAATVVTVALAVGLAAGSVQFAVHAQQVLAGPTPADGGGVVLDARPGSGFRDADVAGIELLPGVGSVVPAAAVPTTLVDGAGEPVVGLVGASTVLVPWSDRDGGRLLAGRAPRRADEVVLSEQAAVRSGLGVGDRAALVGGTGVRAPVVVGVALPGAGDLSPEPWVAAPPATVRRTGALGVGWPRLVVSPARGTSDETLARGLRAAVAPVARVRTAGEVRRALAAQATAAAAGLGSGLGSFALVGTFVGVFVISSALRALSRQRVRQLALLRAVGAGGRQVRRTVRAEALLIGVVGGVLGVPVALGVAAVSSWLLARAGLDTGGAGWRPGVGLLALCVVVGVLVCQLAARRAGREAARTSPMEVLREVATGRSGGSRPRALLGAALLVGAGAITAGAVAVGRGTSPDAAVGAGSLTVVAALVAITAVAVVLPFVVAPLGGLLSAAGRRRPPGAWLAGAHVAREPAGAASAASLLMVSVALLTLTAAATGSGQEGAAARAGSRVSATQAVLPADVTDGGPGLPADLPATVQRSAAVEAVGVRGTDAVIGAGPRRVIGIDPARLDDVLRLDVLGAPLTDLGPGEVALAPRDPTGRVGDEVAATGPGGTVALRVVATYEDPSGVLAGEPLVDLATATTLDPGAGVRAVLVRAQDDPATTARVRRAVQGVPTATTLGRQAYLARIGDDSITGEGLVLGFLAMAVAVAVVGLAVTLALSVTERTRQLALLRAVGALPAQVGAVLRWEAALVVVVGVGLGVSTGLATVQAMRVVTASEALRAHLTPAWWTALVLGAVLTTAVTSLLPARRAGRTPVLTAVDADG